MKTATLYERIGGRPAIEALVTSFYQRVLFDPELERFFRKTAVEKLRSMQIAFFTIALDGPEPGFPISLRQAHAGRGIQREHLSRFTGHLLSTLEEAGFGEEITLGVVQRISMYADEVLGDAQSDG
jgi:hemoglobin